MFMTCSLKPVRGFSFAWKGTFAISSFRWADNLTTAEFVIEPLAGELPMKCMNAVHPGDRYKVIDYDGNIVGWLEG